MGLVTFSFFNIAFSLSTKDRFVLSREVLLDRTFFIATIVSVIVTFMMAEFGLLQRILGTVDLNAEQWLACILVGLSIIVVWEIRKLVWQDKSEDAEEHTPAAAPTTEAS